VENLAGTGFNLWYMIYCWLFIFILRQMQEKFRGKGKKLYFGLLDLQKACDGFQEKCSLKSRKRETLK